MAVVLISAVGDAQEQFRHKVVRPILLRPYKDDNLRSASPIWAAYRYYPVPF
jgi:hypothetical protein